MNAWFDSLGPRDRRMLSIGAGVATLLLGWAWIWQPLSASRDQWRERALRADERVAWMRQAASALTSDGALVPTVSTDRRSLLARVDTSAREAGLVGVLVRVDPVGPGEVRVLLQQAPFDLIVDWLHRLSTTYGVRVDALTATRVNGVGLVDARIVLRE